MFYNGSSFSDIPLFYLPKTHDDSYWDIINWSKDYSTIHDLYMSGYNERYAYLSLINKKGALLKNGFDVAKKIKKLTNTEVYIEIFYISAETSLNSKIFENIDAVFNAQVGEYKISLKYKLAILP